MRQLYQLMISGQVWSLETYKKKCHGKQIKAFAEQYDNTLDEVVGELHLSSVAQP